MMIEAMQMSKAAESKIIEEANEKEKKTDYKKNDSILLFTTFAFINVCFIFVLRFGNSPRELL